MCRLFGANDAEGRSSFRSPNNRRNTAAASAPVRLPAWHVNERCAAGPGRRAGRLLRTGRLRGAGSPDRNPMSVAFVA
jgi:hypothetical protein